MTAEVKKPDKLIDMKIPLECPACGKNVPASARVHVKAPEGWKINEFLFKVGIKAHGSHDDCPVVNVAGAISAEKGLADLSYMTEEGGIVRIWKGDQKDEQIPKKKEG